jgi:hypothetical protein
MTRKPTTKLNSEFDKYNLAIAGHISVEHTRSVYTYGNSAGRINNGWRNNDLHHVDDSCGGVVKLADSEAMAGRSLIGWGT